MGQTIGVIGLGKTPPANAEALLEDYVKDFGDTVFVVPLVTGLFTENVERITQWALEQGAEVIGVMDEKSEKARKLKPYLESLSLVSTEDGEPPLPVLVEVVEAQDGDKVFVVLWDDEDSALVETLELAAAAEISALDLTDGLTELEFADDDATAEGDVDSDGEEAEPPVDDAVGADETPEEDSGDDTAEEFVEPPAADHDEAQAFDAGFENGLKTWTTMPNTVNQMYVPDNSGRIADALERIAAALEHRIGIRPASQVSKPAEKPTEAPGEAPKRRGRPPKPRDADGNIIK